MQEPRDEPKAFMLPPVFLLLAFLTMLTLHALVPGPRWGSSAWRALGVLPILAGVVLAVIGRRQFDKAGTAIRPFEASTALVTDGLFRFSRNPMYLGMILALVGVGVALGSSTPFVVPPLFAALLTMRFIRREEEMLDAQFGDAYRGYKQRVRRWL